MAGLLSGAANFASNLFGGSNGPSYNVVPLDPGTQKLINTQASTATDPNAAAKLNAGVAEAGNQGMETEAQANQKAASSGESPGMLQAIRNQYNQQAGKSIQNLIRGNQVNADIVRGQWMSDAAKSAIAQQKVQTQNYENLSNAMNAVEMARAQALSQILGVGGMVAGGYMAGGNRSRSRGTRIIGNPSNGGESSLRDPSGLAAFNE